MVRTEGEMFSMAIQRPGGEAASAGKRLTKRHSSHWIDEHLDSMLGAV